MVLFIPRAKTTADYAFEAMGNAAQAGMQQMQKQAQQKKEAEALQAAGLSPSLLNLPPEARAAAFKSAFETEKQETPLQKIQREYKEAQLRDLETSQNFLNTVLKKIPNSQNQEKLPDETLNIPNLSGEENNILKNLTDEQLAIGASTAGQPGQRGIVGNIFKTEQERRKNEEKIKRTTFESDRAFHTKYSQKDVEEANQLRSSLPKKELALDLSRNAVESGETDYFSLNKLADATGIDLFRTAKGAQLIAAGKENLLSNMSRASAKAQNVWFEQRLNSVFPKIGQSNEANMTVQEMLEGEELLDRAYLNSFDKIASEDTEKYGYERKDIKKRAFDEIKPIERQIIKRSSYKMKEIEEREKGLSKMKSEVGKNVIKGTPLTMAMAKLYVDKFGDNALDVAKKNGYDIPTYEEFEIYNMTPQEYRQGILSE